MQNSTNASVSAAFQTMTQVVNIRQQGTLRLYTVDTDVNITDMAMIDFGYKPRNFTFVHSYFHDGLAGQQDLLPTLSCLGLGPPAV